MPDRRRVRNSGGGGAESGTQLPSYGGTGQSSGPYGLSVEDEEFLGRRLGLIEQWAPEISKDDPDTALDFAQDRNLEDDELMEALVGARDEAKFEEQKKQLDDMDAMEARAVFHSLPDQYREKLLDIGYEEPDPDKGGGFRINLPGVGVPEWLIPGHPGGGELFDLPEFGSNADNESLLGKIGGGLGKGVAAPFDIGLDVLGRVGDVSAAPYRAISHSARAKYDLVARGDRSIWDPRNLTSIDNPFDKEFRDAWKRTDRGEYYWRPGTEGEARDLVGDDFNTVARFAAGDTAQKIVEDEGLEPDSPEWNRRMMDLMGLRSQPKTNQAIKLLNKNKVSIGRLVGDAIFTGGHKLGGDSDYTTEDAREATGYNMISGFYDGTYQVMTDPTIVFGPVAKSITATRWGIRALQLADKASLAARVDQVLGIERTAQGVRDVQRASRLGRLTRPNRFREAGEEIVRMMNDPRPGARRELLRRYPELTNTIDNMERWAGEQVQDGRRGLDSLERYSDYWASQNGWGNMTAAKAGGLKQDVRFLPGMSNRRKVYSALVRKPAHHLMDKSTDLLTDDTWRYVLDNPEQVEKLVEGGSDILNWQQVNSFWKRMAAAPGRFLHAFTQQEPVTKSALPLMSDNATSEFRNWLEFGAYANLPRSVMDDLMDRWLKNPTAGMRGRLATQLLDEILTRSGLRGIPEGKELYETYVRKAKQIYGVGEDGEDLIDAIYPDAQKALAVAMPEPEKLLGMTRHMSTTRNFVGRLSHSWIDKKIGEVWKPSVVMRLGFIPRAVGDELLADLARHGPASYLRTRVLSMNWSRHGNMDQLAERGWEAAKNKGWLKEHMARRFGVEEFGQIADDAQAFEFMLMRPIQWSAHLANRLARKIRPESKLSGASKILEDMAVTANFWAGEQAHTLALSKGRFTKANLARQLGGAQVEREIEVIRRLQRRSPAYMDAKSRLGARHLAADPDMYKPEVKTVRRFANLQQGPDDLVVVPLEPVKSTEVKYRNPLVHEDGSEVNNVDLREINGNLGDFYEAYLTQLGLRADDRLGQLLLQDVMARTVDDTLVEDLLGFADAGAIDDVLAGNPKALAQQAQARFDLLPDDIKADLTKATTNLDEELGLGVLAEAMGRDEAVGSAVENFINLPENAKHFLVNGASDNFLYGAAEVEDRARQLINWRLQLPDMAQSHRDIRRLRRTKDGRNVVRPVQADHTPIYGIYGEADLAFAARQVNPHDMRGALIGRLQRVGHPNPERLADEIIEDFFPDEQFFQERDLDILTTSHHGKPHTPVSSWGTTNEDVAEAVQGALSEILGYGDEGMLIARRDVADDLIKQSHTPQGWDNGVVARGGRGHTWEDAESFQLGPEKWAQADVMPQSRRFVDVPPEHRTFFDVDALSEEQLAKMQRYMLIDGNGNLAGNLDDITNNLLEEIEEIRFLRDTPETIDPSVADLEYLNDAEEISNLLAFHGRRLEPSIPLDEWDELRRMDPNLPQLKPSRLEGGATMREARDGLAEDLVADLMSMVNHKRMLHEVINPAARGQLDPTHVLNGVAATELPLKAYGPQMVVIPPKGKWSQLVRFGFDKVIGPPIDSLVRSPQYIRAVGAAMEFADKGADMFIRNPELVKGAAAVASKHDRKLWELMGDMDELSDDLLKPNASIDKVRQALGLGEGFTGEDMAALRRYRSNWRAGEEYVAQMSNQRAVMELMNFIDDNRIRSYFQTYVRNLVPFHFAEEQFVKRMGRSIAMSPDAIRRGQLTMHGLRASGIIQEDEYGNQVIVYPLVGPAMDLIGAAGKPIWGDWKVPVPVTMTGDVRYMTPGFDQYSQGRPGFSPGPMVALPLNGLSRMFPELQGLEDAATGRQGYNRELLDYIVPSSVKRFMNAMDPQETQATQLSAMQYMASVDPDGEKGIYLTPDATEAETQEFLERVQNWSRTLGVVRGLFGFSVPASPSVVVDPEANLENVSQEWDPKFTEYMQSGLPMDEAVAQYLEWAHDEYGRNFTPYTVFATKRKSGALMPASEDYLNFSRENRPLLDKFPYAAPWLGPQNDDEDGFNRRAYYDQIIHGMRERKDPEEWISDMHDARASKDYFDKQRRFQLDVATAEPGSEQADQITQDWEDFKRQYLTAHPLFKYHLQSGESRTRRFQVLREMRQVASDPEAPGVLADNMRELVEAFDEMNNHMYYLKNDQRQAARQRKQQIKSDFVDYALALVEQEPGLMGFFNSVIWPELGVEGNPFTAPEVVANQFDLIEGD